MNGLNIERPAPLKKDAGPFHVLQHMAKMQQFRLYKIQEAQSTIKELEEELKAESSMAAGILQVMQQNFRNVEMAYLMDSRHLIGMQSISVTDEDIQKEGNLD